MLMLLGDIAKITKLSNNRTYKINNDLKRSQVDLKRFEERTEKFAEVKSGSKLIII